MKKTTCCLIAILLLAGTVSVQADSFTETFSGGSNQGGWLFNGTGSILPNGGNPDAWLSAVDVDTFGPMLASNPSVSSPFTGNYVERGITSIGFDGMSNSDFNTAGDPAFSITLRLRDSQGTPFDQSDDLWVYIVGDELIPQPADGWKPFDFEIPSDFVGTLPTGWVGGEGFDVGLPAGVTFADVISNVDQVEFLWLDPDFFAIFQQWDVGADNIRITAIPEPGGFAILAGLAAYVAMRRREA